MADFNAGSIEGTLELNNAPFKAGLAEARMQAAQFEGKKVTAKADLNKGEFDAKKTTAETDLKVLGAKKADPSVGLNISEFMAKYAILQKVLNPGGLSGDGKGILGLPLGGAKIAAMVGGIMSLVAAAAPAGAVLTGFGAAAAAAFGGVAVSLGLFGAAAKSAFGEIEKANKAGVQLTGWAGHAQTALAGLSKAWDSLTGSVKPTIFATMTYLFNALSTSVLPKLHPLLQATASGVLGIVKQVTALANTPLFTHFLASLTSFMGGFLHGLGPVLTALLTSWMHAFIALQPLLAELGHGVTVAANALAHFTAGNGLTQFVAYVQSAVPPVMHLLSALIHAIFNIAKGLAPLAAPALHFLGALVTAVGHIHLAPLSRGFGDMLTALEPLLPILGHLINVLLRPLGQLLSSLAHGPVHTLTNGLAHELRPAFHALRGILHDLVQPLSDFAGSIANLANPTGVHLVTKLLVGFRGVVHQLAPPLGRLAVALESVVDNGLSLIIPLLPGLGKGLGIVAVALTPVVNGFAALLSHKAVVGVLLGLVGAFKALQIISAIAKAWAVFNAALATFLAMSEAEGIMAGIAAVSPAVAAGIDLIGVAIDFALGPVGLIIIGVAALAAGLIYAYKHSQTFRDIVNGAFHAVEAVAKSVFNWLTHAVSNTVDFIKAHWELLLSILIGPIGAAALYVITHWTQVKDFFGTAMHDIVSFVSNGVNSIALWFGTLPGKVLSFVGQMLNAGTNLFMAVFHGIESVDSTIMNFISGLISRIIGAFSGIGSKILGVITGSLHSAASGVGGVIGGALHHIGLASGGVTTGPTHALIGDNPGGNEAVVPLDKYDIPRKGEVAAIANRAASDNAKIIGLLSIMAQYLAKGSDHEALAKALGEVIGKNSDAQTRRLIQAARAA